MNRQFQKTINYEFRGVKIALWVFGLITVVTIGRSGELINRTSGAGDAGYNYRLVKGEKY